VSHHDSFRVHLEDGQVLEAKVLGTDPQTDVALLQIDGAHELPVVHLGQSQELAVGDWVVAVGSPLGLEQSVTRGIVSAKGRGSLGLYADGYADFVQTDAAISPGNSGGPLFNLRGEVVGMNTAVSGIGQGLGFAVPIDQVKNVLAALHDEGKVRRGWLGISGSDQNPQPGRPPQRGARVSAVHPSTPAAKAGLRDGDLVTRVDGRAVEDFDDLRGRIGEHPPGDEVALEVTRAGKALRLTATLSERPSPTALGRFGTAQPAPMTRADPSRPGPEVQPRLQPPSPPTRLGVEVESTSAGLEIRRVMPGSLAQRLGLKTGDLLTEVNGHRVSNPRDVANALASSPDKTTVRAQRGEVSYHGAVQRFGG
jgi:serine protease Do